MADNKVNEGFIARFFQRDSDTLLDWNNLGVLLFQIFHEWGDSFDPSTGETGRIIGERYNPATDSYEPDCTAGTPVFNGRQSGLWDCVEQAWPEDMAAMYRAMRAAGLNAETLWQMITEYRGEWCEALYAADAMGYVNTGRFDMAYGDKAEAIRAILKSRFRYLDSKYGANTSTPLVLRLWGNGKGVALRYYCPLYASINWGAGGILTERQINPGEPSFFPSQGVTFNETTVTFYNADLLTEITTYDELPDGTRVEQGLQGLATRIAVNGGLEYCKRLKRLEMDYLGSEANTNLDAKILEGARASVAMRRFVVTNCPNVTGSAQFASQVIEEIDFRNTGVSGVSVPETDTLKTMRLGAGMVSLTLKNLTGLTTLTAQGIDKLQSIEVENCPKASAGMMEILRSALDAKTLRIVRITNVEWKNFEAKYLERLADLGAELTGVITLKAGERMTFALKQKCIAAWGDIDAAGNPLRIEYAVSPLSIVRISGAGYWGEAKEYQLKAVSENQNANDFRSVEWSMEENPYAEIDTLTGRVSVHTVGTEEDSPSVLVTVKVTKLDGSVVSRSVKVGFYERTAQIGDFVYADGTCSDVYDENRTVVAICFYVDPADPTLRLGVCPRSIGSGCWGNDAASVITLADDPAYDTFDIKDIPNTGEVLTVPILSETPLVWDITGGKTNNRHGFMNAPEDIVVDGKFTISAGSKIPIGMYETYVGIRHRNKILTDSGIGLDIPTSSEGASELSDYYKLIAEANEKLGNKGYRYYFPIFSMAFAYQPTLLKAGETLDTKFRSHMWFLPAPGDAYIYWHLNKNLAAFSESEERMGASLHAGDFSVTGEYGDVRLSLHLVWKTGKGFESYGSNGKYNNQPVLPIVWF